MKKISKDCHQRGNFNDATQKCDCTSDSHSYGNQCEHCDEGYVEYSGKCLISPCAVKEPCGCLPRVNNDDPCVPKGQCIESEDRTKFSCNCNLPFGGENCKFCAVGFTNLPACDKRVEGCNPPCKRGLCNATSGVCICPSGFKGETCEEEIGWDSGKIFGGVGAVVLALSLVGILIWWFKFRKGTKYEEVDKLDVELEDKDEEEHHDVELDSGDDEEEGGKKEEASQFLVEDDES